MIRPDQLATLRILLAERSLVIESDEDLRDIGLKIARFVLSMELRSRE